VRTFGKRSSGLLYPTRSLYDLNWYATRLLILGLKDKSR
jgi:hypothetical protein